MRSIGGFGLERWTPQMGTQHNTRHILHIAQKGSSPHDMSCPSKGITLCQSLIGTQGKFLCNTNTRALHSKVILTHTISWPKSYNANSTLLTMIHLKVLPWVVVGAGGLGAGKTSGAGTRGVFLDVVIGGRTRDTDTNGGESSENRSKVHADCGPAENPSL